MTGKKQCTNKRKPQQQQTWPKHYKYLSSYYQFLSMTGQHSKFATYLLAVFKQRQRKCQIAT